MAKPEGINDLQVLWAIRDIPKSILNLQRKGILLLFVSCIGMRDSCYYNMKQLEDKMGANERTLRDHFHYLEDIGFLVINRPDHYTNKKSNEYRLNYSLIIETAEKYTEFHEQKTAGKNCRQVKTTGKNCRYPPAKIADTP